MRKQIKSADVARARLERIEERMRKRRPVRVIMSPLDVYLLHELIEQQRVSVKV